MPANCPRCGNSADLPPCANCAGNSFHFGPLSDGSEGLICNLCNMGRSYIPCAQCGAGIPALRFMSGAYQNLRDARGAGCFIATELYGSGSAEVARLQGLRDQVLLKTRLGRAFVGAYYRTSPKIIPLMRSSNPVRLFFRASVALSLLIVRHAFPSRGNQVPSKQDRDA